jgi:hypothetical protein
MKNSSLSEEDGKTAGLDKENQLKQKQPEISKKMEESYFKNLQSKMSGILGKKVFINADTTKNGSQSGKLEIEYKNSEELESIIKVLCGGDIFDN